MPCLGTAEAREEKSNLYSIWHLNQQERVINDPIVGESTVPKGFDDQKKNSTPPTTHHPTPTQNNLKSIRITCLNRRLQGIDDQ